MVEGIEEESENPHFQEKQFKRGKKGGDAGRKVDMDGPRMLTET